MAKEIIDGNLWALIKPLLPPAPPRPWGHPGRKRIDDRKALSGIVFVLASGIPWEMLPREMGCGCGMTCWRRLHEWQQKGAWDRIWKILLEQLHRQGKLDWSRAIADSSTIRAVGGGGKNRAFAGGSRPARQQAPSAGRRARGAPGGHAHRGQPQ